VLTDLLFLLLVTVTPTLLLAVLARGIETFLHRRAIRQRVLAILPKTPAAARRA
jgi:hypothetical protein